uniref:ATP synthase complex subunit 8 n=1 Tax=Tribolium castaneum TaxID=7070 RepID=A0A8F8AG30_TRICA|nr:ATP synthase F0 subunit 8 [Tribolium castaneum]
MPQMAPLNWLVLMIIFINIMIMFNMTNYYSFIYPVQKFKKTELNKTTINWKW